MKTPFFCLIVFCFSQCSSSKFVTKLPFKIDNAYYKTWFNAANNTSGLEVHVYTITKKPIAFKALFFKQKKAMVSVKTSYNGQHIVGRFTTNKKDIVLHNNSTKELQNTLPNTSKLPFKTEGNTAILSVIKNDKIIYYKVKNIKNID